MLFADQMKKMKIMAQYAGVDLDIPTSTGAADRALLETQWGKPYMSPRPWDRAAAEHCRMLFLDKEDNPVAYWVPGGEK